MLWLQFFPPLCTRWLGSGLGHLCRRVGRSFCSCWCPPLFRTIPAIGFTDGCTASGVKTTSSTFTTGTLHPSATGTLARDLDFGDPILARAPDRSGPHDCILALAGLAANRVHWDSQRACVLFVFFPNLFVLCLSFCRLSRMWAYDANYIIALLLPTSGRDRFRNFVMGAKLIKGWFEESK